MDKVTQSNAAAAEQSASASEELNEQAGALRDAVLETVPREGAAESPKAAVANTNKTIPCGCPALPSEHIPRKERLRR